MLERYQMHPILAQGIQLFNAERYFECHEVLEELWRSDTSVFRDLYQGLIKVAVALHHARQGNFEGAHKVLISGLKQLRLYTGRWTPVLLDDLMPALERWQTQINHVPLIELRLAKPHALVVGGTGMLWGVSLELARRGYSTSVIARSKPGLQKLARAACAAGGFINPIAVDVYDEPLLTQKLLEAIARYGPILLAIDWASPNDSLAIAKRVGSAWQPCEFFHVLGSSAADPSRPDPERRARFEALPNLRYHEVILGFVIEASGSRWLTHEEICQGILQAIDRDASRFIVGTVEPWSARP